MRSRSPFAGSTAPASGPGRRASSRARPRRARGGFTLLELAIVMVIMTVAVGMLSSTMTSSSRIGPLMREEALAAEAARFQIETLRAGDFATLWARYNADPADDPDGPGTAPGPHFDVAGLEARPFDADGRVGRIEFPEFGGDLREDTPRDDFGLPRDLNQDGLVDDQPRNADYTFLPFAVRIEWQGANGPRELRLYSSVVAP